MIKLTTLILLLVSFGSSAISQSYVEYYMLCNQADSLEYIHKNQEALESYKAAFKTVDYVHSDKYKSAYQIAIKTNSFADAYEFGKMIIINSGKKEFIQTKSKDFKNSVYYQQLADSTDYFLSKFNERVNHQFIDIIDSLMFIDQYIIRNNREYKGKYALDKSKLPENRFDLDSSNWNLLYECIQEMGFPSEEHVGYEAYDKVWAILHHNLRLKENERYHNEIFEFVKAGDYLPEHMMFWYEQFQMQEYKQTYFTTWDGNISEENLQRVDANRRRFYLKGINSYELAKSGRMMTAKW